MLYHAQPNEAIYTGIFPFVVNISQRDVKQTMYTCTHSILFGSFLVTAGTPCQDDSGQIVDDGGSWVSLTGCDRNYCKHGWKDNFTVTYMYA